MPLHRRAVLQAASGAAIGAGLAPALARPPRLPRVRPADPAWPGPAAWDSLANAVGGNLIRVRPLFAACEMAPESAACASMLTSIKNPYYIGDHPAGTQTSGWIDAWRSEPSAFAVAARSTRDVVAAVNFARAFRLRLVIKGGGHSYLGGSNAPDSLLVWTRPMDGIRLHDAFIPRGCAGAMPPGTGRLRSNRRTLDSSVQRRHHGRRTICPGRRMRHRRRRRPSPRQRVRQLLQSLRLSREFPARGRDRHRRWCSSYRQS